MFHDRLKKWAVARGYRTATASADVLDVVRKKLEGRRKEGMIEPGFFAKNLSGFRYLDSSGIGGRKSLVMVAVPRPVSILPFRLGEKRIDGLIPPTYVQYKKTFEDVLADLKANVLMAEDDATGAEILSAPLKSLAVHMGLVSYGRNNITFAPGLGSGYQLCGYVVATRNNLGSDMGGSGTASTEGRQKRAGEIIEAKGENGSPDWKEKVMDRCSSCRACFEVCPTGAIREDRFLISAERCYTLFSESREPMPEWIRPPKSICMIGCMACQEICPENKGRLRYEASGEEFTAEETEAVLDMGRRFAAGGEMGGSARDKEKGDKGGRDKGEGEKEARGRRTAADSVKHGKIVDGGCARLASESARDKLNRLGMSEDIEVIARNLWILLDQRGLIGSPR